MAKKKPETTIDWDEVERHIRFGMHQTLPDTSVVERAWRSDPERYSELRARVQKEEHRKINPLL